MNQEFNNYNEQLNQSSNMYQQPVNPNNFKTNTYVAPEPHQPNNNQPINNNSNQPVHAPTYIPNSLNVNNYSTNNNGSSSKKKLYLIIAIIVIILLIVVLLVAGIFNKKENSNSNTNNEQSDNQDVTDNKITGNVELIKEYKKDAYNIRLARGFEDGPYFKYVNDVEKTENILDKNGKVLFSMESSTVLHNILYIDDGYFVDFGYAEDKFQIIDTKGNKQTFNTGYKNTFYYNEGILYYSYLKNNVNVTQAYDLKNKKVLWEFEGGINPFLLENDKVVLQKSTYDSNILIVDKKTGELVKTKDSKNTYASENAYYLVNENSIEIYDYNNNKLSAFTLENNDDYSLKLEAILNTGGFVIKKYDKKKYSSTSLYTVYNKYSKEIFSFETDGISSDSLYTFTYGGGLAKKQSNSKYSILKAEKSDYRAKTYVIYSDDSYLEMYGISIIGKCAIGYVGDNDKRIKIVNLETKEEKILSEDLKNTFASSGNNAYFIIDSNYSDKDNKHIVYDANFNKIYSTKNTLKVVNDDYFMEIDSTVQDQSKIYLINKATLDKKLLETKGVYDFHTTNSLVTYEFNGAKQWLYKLK